MPYKTALMLKNGMIPANLHFITPNPKIPFDELKLRVPTSLEPWPETRGKFKIAGVNSFGFGGTNVHAVLQEYEPFKHKAKPEIEATDIQIAGSTTGKAYLVPISAHSREALEEIVRAYIQYIGRDVEIGNISLSAIGCSASLHKGHHSNRLTVTARSKGELTQMFESFLAGEKRTGISYGQAQKESGKTAFIFSGMGSQWWGMGRQLYQKEPVFRKVIEDCDILFKRLTNEWSLIGELLADEEASRINETRISQPCIFSVQAALYVLWHSWGIVPDAVIGHSVGEVAAYYAAGVLSLEDAVTVCFHRSRLQQLKAGQGGMLVVGIPIDKADELVGKFTDKVSVAAVNSKDSLTLAGDMETLEEISTLLEKENKFARFLKVEVPYHSPVMDSIVLELQECLSGITPHAGNKSVVSTVTGGIIDGRQINAAYWAQNVRKPVLFAAAFSQLLETGFDKFIEISAHPVLAASIKHIHMISV